MTFGTLALVLVVWASSAQQPPAWATKNYHVLVDGNELYSRCQTSEKVVRLSGDQVQVDTAAGMDLFYAGRCWGYIMGVVDSIPAGEDFDPDPGVRASQEVDVVLAYLRSHPESRHLPAYALVRYALTEAFPARAKH
jgi:hypothetical protein